MLVISRNAGFHRNYINMTQADSVRVLIDAVYEPHWQHYAADFGRTIAGFFSDEPELGNGFLYDKGNQLGIRQDLPWGKELEEELPKALGDDWARDLQRLWEEDISAMSLRTTAITAGPAPASAIISWSLLARTWRALTISAAR